MAVTTNFSKYPLLIYLKTISNSTKCLNNNIVVLSKPLQSLEYSFSFINSRNKIAFKELVPKGNPCAEQKIFEQVRKQSLTSSNHRYLFNFGRNKDDDDENRKKRVPKLILLQNPFKWIMIKIDFSVLKNIWDPSFEVNEFKYGTKQTKSRPCATVHHRVARLARCDLSRVLHIEKAISRVTQAISEGQYSDLNGLLTRAARLSLLRELDRNWSDRQRSLLALKNDDIQITAPRKVYFIRIAEKKFCDVDMAFLALKWVPINRIEALIFTEIFARFHREYSPHCIPEWTIAYFKITRFQVLRR